jgi:general secretion pathway protein G
MIARPASRRLAAHRRAGFTLVEVLVVVAILVILASLATFATMRVMGEAKENECKLKMQKVEQACKQYMTLNDGTPPQSLEELINPTADGKPPLLEGGPSAITSPWGSPFMFEMVTDNYGSPRVVISTTNQAGTGTIQWPQR